MKHAYPLSFLEALLDTADAADLTDHVALTAVSKLRHIVGNPPSQIFNHACKELVPRVAWAIENADGEFFGPGIAY